MKNFTFIRTGTSLVILLVVLFSGFVFGQMKKPDVPSVDITFQVDMTYQFAKGAFNPLVDFVDIAGTMNGWAGSAHMTASSSLVYEIVYTLESDTIQEYKFRINGLWATSEFPNGGPNRMYLVPNHPDTVKSVYTDYNPGTVPMTFKCNMSYQIKIGVFDKEKDYLDFAGTINNWGAYDVLFDRGNDSIYEFNVNIDTSYIVNQTPIEFKFRINGDWATSEFPNGGAPRIGRVQDTINGFVNLVEVWYNDQDPNIPAPPVAYDLSIQGNLSVGETLTGSYSYLDINGDLEGTSLYKWLRADSVTQVTPDTISGALAVNYLLTSDDAGKYLAFMVTPVAVSGTLLTGLPVVKWTDSKVYGVGFKETNRDPVRFYPNPVNDQLAIENLTNVEKVEIFSVVGQKVFTVNVYKTSKIAINTTTLKAGVYFIKFYNTETGTSTSKFIKN
jgi:hypothetical protein